MWRMAQSHNVLFRPTLGSSARRAFTELGAGWCNEVLVKSNAVGCFSAFKSTQLFFLYPGILVGSLEVKVFRADGIFFSY